MSDAVDQAPVPWLSMKRARWSVFLGFVVPLPYPPAPVALLLILLLFSGGVVGDHNFAVGGPELYLMFFGLGLGYAVVLYVIATLWLRFGEGPRWML